MLKGVSCLGLTQGCGPSLKSRWNYFCGISGRSLRHPCDLRRAGLNSREYTPTLGNRNFSGTEVKPLCPNLGATCSDRKIRAVWANLVLSSM